MDQKTQQLKNLKNAIHNLIVAASIMDGKKEKLDIFFAEEKHAFDKLLSYSHTLVDNVRLIK